MVTYKGQPRLTSRERKRQRFEDHRWLPFISVEKAKRYLSRYGGRVRCEQRIPYGLLTNRDTEGNQIFVAFVSKGVAR